MVPRELINLLVVTVNESACESCLKFCAEHAERCLFCKLSSKGWRTKIIINIVYSQVWYLAAVFIRDSFIRAISRFGIDSFVTWRKENDTRNTYARLMQRYMIRVMGNLASIIIQIDEPTINERLFALINKIYNI